MPSRRSTSQTRVAQDRDVWPKRLLVLAPYTAEAVVAAVATAFKNANP